MKAAAQVGRVALLAILGIAALEIIIMKSPAARAFYGVLRFDALLGLCSRSQATAWLAGFFLPHCSVSGSWALQALRELGMWLFALGIWGAFLASAQTWRTRLQGHGLAQGLLYRHIRHPQYLCLAIAGLGLLTIWPRFLLLGVQVALLFVYASLARAEERRLAARHGEAWRSYAAARGAFLPGRSLRRLLRASQGRLPPRALFRARAFALCLFVAFCVAFLLRACTLAHTATLALPAERALLVSMQPQPQAWMEKMYRAALADAEARAALKERRHSGPVAVAILPPRYGMEGKFHLRPGSAAERPAGPGADLLLALRRVLKFLLPVKGWLREEAILGVDPSLVDEPIQLVFLRPVGAPGREEPDLDALLDAGANLQPIVAVELLPSSGQLLDCWLPERRTRFGRHVLQPLF